MQTYGPPGSGKTQSPVFVPVETCPRFRVTWKGGQTWVAYADDKVTAMILYSLVTQAILGDPVVVEELVDGEYRSRNSRQETA